MAFIKVVCLFFASKIATLTLFVLNGLSKLFLLPLFLLQG